MLHHATTLAPPLLPADVRLMNAVANAIVALAALALVAAGVLWLTRTPLFTIRAIELDGDLARNNVETIRANAMPLLSGNFFGVSLRQARAAFESVPWVRRAVVRRIWPDRLAVRLQEYRAAALWDEADGDDRLVDEDGEVFVANVGEVEDEGLPTFSGPPQTAPQMLAMYRRLAPLFPAPGRRLQALALSGRGSWRAELGDGTTIELGRGSDDEVLARTARFVRTLPQVTARYTEPLAAADLRHLDGYAVRLHGVTTGTPPAKSAARAKPTATTGH
jgi:cell division protein FtsQ